VLTAPFPTVGHVTLRGSSEARRVGELRDEIRAWAAGISPIELQVDAVDAFPAPFQIVITRLARTASLVDAYSSLIDRPRRLNHRDSAAAWTTSTSGRGSSSGSRIATRADA